MERYSSPEYFDSMRRAWETMLSHVEDCLARFMTQLPADYRNRPLPMQPDVVWGQRVLPNFRRTSLVLDDGFIKLTHGDASGLFAAAGVNGGVRGQREFSSDWFDEVDPDAGGLYHELLYKADMYASNISATVEAGWPQTVLSTDYSTRHQGPLDAPAEWPKYELDVAERIRTGEPVKESGVYLPDIDDSCAQFLVAGKPAPPALIGFDGQQYVSANLAIWTRVRRVEGESVADGLADLSAATEVRQSVRVPGGDVCPRSGWWFTPSRAASRRYFNQGESFPIVEGSEYGVTFWQWDVDQSHPQL
nr:hypothetical protein [Cupriavidus sp. UGS-1]